VGEQCQEIHNLVVCDQGDGGEVGDEHGQLGHVLREEVYTVGKTMFHFNQIEDCFALFFLSHG